MNAHTIWQVSGGPTDRSYADQFLNYGVALIGPGDTGPWCSEWSDEFEDAFVRRFATELRTGDILLLRTGLSTICAIGLVASGYRYLSQFDDVNGWGLQHGRRVRWCPLPDAYDFGSQVFGANPPRLSRVQAEDLVEYAHRFVRSPPTNWQTDTLPSLPAEETSLEIAPAELQELVAQVHDLSGLYWDVDAFGERPMEDELVTHCVIPFLRALGWPVERIAVKWRNIDVCVFSDLPRIPEHCHYLIEAKRLGAGVEGALDQAIGYVLALGIRRDVVVTDGIRYRMYDASKNFAPVVYANLARLKQSSLELFERMRSP
ncbi:MAG: hypothetical protein OXQ89_04140 [Rhodospirillaceae bacterium]|nr:hypothetical protein [Rhodospirillaceae bacterium]